MSWYMSHQFKEKPKTAREAIEMAGLNWEVGKTAVNFTTEGGSIASDRVWTDGGKTIAFPYKFVTYRKDNNQPLGIVGSDYHVVQNNTVFDFIDPIIADGSVEYYGGGEFNYGKFVWLQLRLTGKQIDLGQNDQVEKYILLLNSHNCFYKLTVMFTPIRIVCQNTLNVAISVAKKRESGIVSIKHCKFMTDKIEEAKKVMNVAVDHYSQIEEKYRRMTMRRMSRTDLINYANNVVNLTKNDVKSNVSVKINKAEAIINAAYGSPGSEKFPASLWNAYNGAVYYADYLKSNLRAETISKTNTFNEESILFGAKARLKTRAYDAAVDILTLDGKW